ncbi:hypothetical protein [Candidatus Uabimicrobium sp. HlEnr_7]|uniref:hypothetical protein n=1 Tax=Candidatus Uabimicrobium helgolandensis TaxID=3095367 RepID=UPI003556A315
MFLKSLCMLSFFLLLNFACAQNIDELEKKIKKIEFQIVELQQQQTKAKQTLQKIQALLSDLNPQKKSLVKELKLEQTNIETLLKNTQEVKGKLNVEYEILKQELQKGMPNRLKPAPVKEYALQILTDFYVALSKKDYKKATSYQLFGKRMNRKTFISILQEEGLHNNVISQEGINALEKLGKWGTFEEVFGKKRNNLFFLHEFEISIEDCYGLNLENAEAKFHWNGSDLKIIHCKNIAKVILPIDQKSILKEVDFFIKKTYTFLETERYDKFFSECIHPRDMEEVLKQEKLEDLAAEFSSTKSSQLKKILDILLTIEPNKIESYRVIYNHSEFFKPFKLEKFEGKWYISN